MIILKISKNCKINDFINKIFVENKIILKYRMRKNHEKN